MKRVFLIIILVLTTGVAASNWPAQAQSSEVDDETCLACHDGYDTELSNTAHRLMTEGTASPVQCVSCHSGAAIHVEDPTTENIGNPASALPHVTEGTCTSCHQGHVMARTAGYDPHFGQDISCTDCHQVHTTHEHQLLDEEAGFCADCHTGIVSQFERRSNHPLTQEAVSCISCHDFSGNLNIAVGHGAGANCYSCHAEQAGPYLYEHEATSTFSTHGDGCLSCHNAHGSPNEGLLTQHTQGLCRQCHGVPPMHLTQHGGIGNQHDCIVCHSEVHGSYTSRSFLDPDMGIKVGDDPDGCYCHSLNGFTGR